MVFSQHFFKPSSLCAAVLVAFLFFISFPTFGGSSYLVTIPILFLSTIFIISLSKKKAVVVENPDQDGIPTFSVLEEVGEKIKPKVQNVENCEAATESWMCSNPVGHNITMSVSSVSDDEDDGDDLIEISLITSLNPFTGKRVSWSC